jgi:hypothetical protein
MLNLFLANIALLKRAKDEKLPPQLLMLYHNDCMLLRHACITLVPKTVKPINTSFIHLASRLEDDASSLFYLAIVIFYLFRISNCIA